MSEKFRRYFELQKVESSDDGGSVRVKGICSSETRDADGEIITADAMRKAIPDYMKFGAVREMHSNIAAGVMLFIEVDENGVTHCEADIVDEGTIKKLLHDPPILKGFSVGGKKLARNPHDKKIIEKIKLTEVSLVDRPNNPDALAELAKFDDGEADSEGGPMDPKETPAQTGASTEEPLEKGIYDVRQFADVLQTVGYLVSSAQSETVWEGDASPIPAQLKTWLVSGAEIFKAMAEEEITELLASLKVNNTLALAAHADDLAKAGKKFSKATKGKLAEAHDYLTKAVGCMKDSGYDAEEDDEAKKAEEADDLHKADLSDALAKAAGLTEENDRLKGENETLTKFSGELQDSVKELLVRLETKGALRAVPVDKSKDNGLAKVDATPEEEEALAKAASDPREVVKAMFREGGTPIFQSPR